MQEIGLRGHASSYCKFFRRFCLRELSHNLKLPNGEFVERNKSEYIATAPNLANIEAGNTTAQLGAGRRHHGVMNHTEFGAEGWSSCISSFLQGIFGAFSFLWLVGGCRLVCWQFASPLHFVLLGILVGFDDISNAVLYIGTATKCSQLGFLPALVFQRGLRHIIRG